MTRSLLCLALALAAGCSPGDRLAAPVSDPAAAARAFRLYYRERVDRAVVAYNRFMLFGDVTFATNIGKAGIARQGADFEVVPGPTDNNNIGRSTWVTWHAWRIFRSRTIELSLVRMFNGLHFFEQVSGHPGMTARMVYPGWTRVVDGVAGDVSRTRAGAPVVSPTAYHTGLEEEMIRRFYRGVHITYREDPADFLFDYMPAVEVGPYATTYSFSALPRYLRSSDCCCSLMRTPAPYPWQGAYWGNHNSRDNFPDLALGLVAAMEAAGDASAPREVREAARLAVAAGRRIGDLIVAHDAIMTVDEHNPYDHLVNSGAVRPDGETENEDLGTLADCQMAFLARALSSEGLSTPLPPVEAPSSIEYLLVDLLGQDTSCKEIDGVRVCRRLEEAFCGQDWETMEQMEVFGLPWLELVEDLDQSSPGAAENLIGGFQDDFYEITLAVEALIVYADLEEDRELAARARKVLSDLTRLMRLFADIIYTRTDPDRLAQWRYRAALLDGWAGLSSTPRDDLGDHEDSERQMAYLESWLQMDDTRPAPMLTDEEIREQVANHLAGRSETVKQRYRDAYGDTPPLRVAGEGYEARGVPFEAHPWHPVARPHHRVMGGVKLLYALPLCRTAPGLLDCSWARLGCARVDLNGDGRVDEEDKALFQSASGEHAGSECRAGNGWCGGADLDHTGRVDHLDEAFLQAAEGCWYDPAGP